jgi:dTMP kinase
MQLGPLIVLEGVDGSGKSTLQQALALFLTTLGWSVCCSREPTSGKHGQALREAAKTQRLPPQQELELLLLDRQAHLAELIQPARMRGEAVILDRYFYSNVAYQGAAGLDRAQVLAANLAFAPEPDVLLILDLSVPDALARIRARGLAQDDFEKADTLTSVRECLLSFGSLSFASVLDASESVERVTARACAATMLGLNQLKKR